MEARILKHTHLRKLLQKAYINTTDDLPLFFYWQQLRKI